MSYTCPFCGAESQNSNDERERYCGRCHRFADDETGLRRYAAWHVGRLGDAEYANALEVEAPDDPSTQMIVAFLRGRTSAS